MSMFAEDKPQLPDRARVSMLERAVPAVAFGLASISGIVGAIMTIRIFVQLREAENAGMEAIAEALAATNYAMLGLLGLSILIGVGAVVMNLVRSFSEQVKASPPGFLYLVVGVPNLIAPILVAYAWSVVIDVVLGRNTGNPTETGAWISQILVIAIPSGIASLVLLPIFSFVPFPARRGKKITSIAALMMVVIGITAVAITLSGLADVLMSDPRVTSDSEK